MDQKSMSAAFLSGI